jgi:hypothetical protein
MRSARTSIAVGLLLALALIGTSPAPSQAQSTAAAEPATGPSKTASGPAADPSASPAPSEVSTDATVSKDAAGPPEGDAASSENEASPPATEAQADDDPAAFNPAEPEFTIVNLPTTLRVPTHKAAFRVAHRFARPLGAGDFGDLVSDFFGIDSGATVGLEVRFSPFSRTQVGVHRTSAKVVEFFGQYNVIRQSSAPVSIDALLAVEGTNNFRDSYSPVIGAVVSRTVGTGAAFYAIPMWINNTNPLPKELVDDNDTFALGLGTRLRVLRTVYLVGELMPRLGGYDPGKTTAAFGIEKRVGRHMFQLHFANHLSTTPANLARGAAAGRDDWYMGFNIYRKFF